MFSAQKVNSSRHFFDGVKEVSHAGALSISLCEYLDMSAVMGPIHLFIDETVPVIDNRSLAVMVRAD